MFNLKMGSKKIICFLVIFISYCCCNKLPQTWWLKTTHFIILWSGHLKCISRAVFLLEAPGENLFPFYLLEASCIPWLLASSFIFKARIAINIF